MYFILEKMAMDDVLVSPREIPREGRGYLVHREPLRTNSSNPQDTHHKSFVQKYNYNCCCKAQW